MNITSRIANKLDTEFARRVHHTAYRDVVIKQFGNWDEKIQDDFFESGWKDGLNHDIILFDNNPCGYYSSQENIDDIILNEIVILPECQGRGIGTKILTKQIEDAKKKKKAIKFQVLKANKAIDLYKRLGARKIGETKTHLKMEFNSKTPM